MTSANPMGREELIELAALDAHGLLDEYEAAHYTRSFHDAPAVVQDEILHLQADLAGDTMLVPDEEPRPSLRREVLDSVGEAVVKKLAPLATIGQPRSPATETRLNLTASTPLWRAAAFALAATLIILAYFSTDAYRHGNTIARLALNNNTAAQLEQLIGPTFKDFLFDQHTKRIVLTPFDSDAEFRAVVFINEATNEVFLVTAGLPRSPGEDYTLQVQHADGNVEKIKTFASNGTIGGMRLQEISAAALASATWQITSHGAALLGSGYL
ncbi:MAG: hypothetical protein V3T07_08575 [Myxococcota bacterium]